MDYLRCNRKNCHLSALWQVGFTLQPRWALSQEPVRAWTGIVVCGMHKDSISLDDFSDMLDRVSSIVEAETSSKPGDLLRALEFADISDGTWWHPNHPGRRTKVVLPA